MKRPVLITLSVLVVLFAALLIGPSFVDWNKYKPQIIEQAKTMAGYDVKIDGDLNLSLLPSPRLKIEGLSVAAPKGETQPLLAMKRAEVSVSVLPLLVGAIEVDTIRLINPDIRLETMADGTTSWMSDQLLQKDGNGQSATSGSETTTPESAGNSETKSFVLNNLSIIDGRVEYLDRRTGARQLAEDINVDVQADSLQGPYKADGSLLYGGKTIDIEAQTKARQKDGALPVKVTVGLPEADAQADFSGIVVMEPSLEVQGQAVVTAKNLADALAYAGIQGPAALSQKLSFKTVVTGTENAVSAKEIDVELGDAKGQGSLDITNLKDKNPLQLNADLSFSGMLDLDKFVPAASKPDTKDDLKAIAKGEPSPSTQGGFLPQTLTLPNAFEGRVAVSAESVKYQGITYKGLVLSATKQGGAFDVTAKALDMPGKTSMNATGALRFASTSASGEDSTIYADPTLNFHVTGTSDQVPTLLRAFTQGQDSNPALEIYKTASLDLSGAVTPSIITLTDSVMKLDQTSLALAGSYKPRGAGGKPDVVLDVSTDMVDIDAIQSRLNGQKKQAVQTETTAAPDVKKALEPVRSFDLPINLIFDVSVQKARFNAQDVTGVRLKGKTTGPGLSLDVASVQDLMGAALSLQGGVANLKDVSGVDLKFYGRSDNVATLMQSLKMDTSKLPAQIGKAETNVTLKGSADNLAFVGNVAALGGQVNAAGDLTGILDKPAFSNLSVGAKHPNFVKAVQIMNPSFAGGPGLEKPFEFYAKAVRDGDVYTLSDMKADLGGTTVAGDLKIALDDAKKPSVTGTIKAGDVPLDSLLGVSKKAKSPAPGAASPAAAQGAQDGRWSRTAIETGWMQSALIDLNLSANSITYGGWKFVQPTTRIALKDGLLDIENLKAGLFGGTASLTARLQDPADPKQPLSMAVKSTMDKVDLEPLGAALSGSGLLKAQGDVSLNFDVQSAGVSPYALINSLRGSAALNGQNVVLKGFDLAKLAQGLSADDKIGTSAMNLVNGALSGGETRFDKITGQYDISEGIVTITSMIMDGPSSVIKTTGNANLPRWTIALANEISLKNVTDLAPFTVSISGPLDNPGNTFGKGILEDYLQRKLSRKLAKEAPKVLGDDLSGKLQQLGILPPDQKAAPAPTTPATDATQPAAGEGAQTEPAPAQPATKQENTEKAIRGVLDMLR